MELKDKTQTGCFCCKRKWYTSSYCLGGEHEFDEKRSKLLPEEFYGVTVTEHKYLTMLKESSQIIPIEDIGAVAEQGNRDDKLWVISNVTVTGVRGPYFETNKSCLQCKARVEPHSDRLGKCSKMDRMMMQRFNLCT